MNEYSVLATETIRKLKKLFGTEYDFEEIESEDLVVNQLEQIIQFLFDKMPKRSTKRSKIEIESGKVLVYKNDLQKIQDRINRFAYILSQFQINLNLGNSSLSSSIESLGNEQNDIQKLFDSLSGSSNEKASILSLQIENKQLKEQIQELKNKRNAPEHHFQDTIERIQKDVERCQESVKKYKNKYDDVENQKNIIQSENTQLAQCLLKVHKQKKILKSENKKYLNSYQLLEDHFQKLINEKELLQKKIDELTRAINDLKKENKELKNSFSTDSSEHTSRVNRLQEENRCLQEQKEKLEEEINNLSQEYSSDKPTKDVQNLSSHNEYNDSQNLFINKQINDLKQKNIQLESKLENSEKLNNHLQAQLIKLQGEKMKCIQSKTPKNSGLDLERIGFLLADALSQRFNPCIAEDEIYRLIRIVHNEHIKISESTRVPLNPFQKQINTEYSNTNSTQFFSKFDALEDDINLLKLSAFSHK